VLFADLCVNLQPKIKNFAEQMKKLRQMFCLLLTVCTLSSCLTNDDNEVILYNDAAITAFTLGTLTQYEPGTSTVVATLTGSNYKMAIDQINYRVFNRDSLPIGTAINNVLCSVTAAHSGGIAIQNLDNDLFQWYSSSIPYDFSQKPRIFRIFATDGTYYRDYKVSINVSKAKTKDIWTAKADTTLLGSFTDMRLVALDTLLVVFGKKNGTTQVCISKNKGLTWESGRTFNDTTVYSSAIVKNDTLFTLSKQQLYYTKNAEQWDSLANSWNLKQLVAAGTKELFALTNDSLLKASTDHGASWNPELVDSTLSTDSVKHMLALNAVSGVSFPFEPVKSSDYVLFVGNNGKQSVIWRKISQYKNTKPDQWVNIPIGDYNKYPLPLQSRLSLTYGESSVLAFGSSTTVYQSTDQGISWRSNTTYALPAEMITVAADKKGTLWAISVADGKGKVWRGSKY
jgi:hypothetical protein